MHCIDAYKNLYVQERRGEIAISPCCVSATHVVDKLDFEADQRLEQVRKDFEITPWPNQCSVCKNNEQKGFLSRRQGSNQWYQDNDLYNNQVELVRLDYWVGDLCNLACVICGPDNSSLWKQQIKMPIIEQKTVVNRFWNDLDLTKLRYVHFNGGEPLLSKEHVDFLFAIPNKSQVSLSYNTNATVLPSNRLNDLWLQFKLVELCFSIDDVEQRYEYQRWPAKWPQVQNNLSWYIENGNHNSLYVVNTAVSLLNQHNLHSLESWLKNNFAKTKFSDDIHHRKQLATGAYNLSANIFRVRQMLDSLDQSRGTNWRTTFPELSN